MVTLFFKDESALIDWGRRAGAGLTRNDCIFLKGDLGAGKTTLVRALSEGLGVEENSVTSPTFAVHQMYEGRLTIHHLDGYRLEHSSEYEQVGIDCLPAGVLFIEWPEKFDLRAPTAIVTLVPKNNGRELTIEATADHPLVTTDA